MDTRRGQFAVLRAQAGDRSALDEVLREVQREVFGYLVRVTRDHHLAEDALQDTLLIVCRQIRWVRDPRCFRAWVFRLATREAMRRLRSEHRRRATARDAAHEVIGTETPCPPDADEIREILARTDGLPPNSRAVIHLHYGIGLSIGSVAAVLGVPEGTAKSRLAYALGVLRRKESER